MTLTYSPTFHFSLTHNTQHTGQSAQSGTGGNKAVKTTSNYTNSSKLQALRENNSREQQANMGYLGVVSDPPLTGSGNGSGSGSNNLSSLSPSSSSSASASASSWSGAHLSIMGPPEAVHLFNLQSFLLATLAHLPFDYIEEPLQAVYWVGRNVPITANVLLGRFYLIHLISSHSITPPLITPPNAPYHCECTA